MNIEKVNIYPREELLAAWERDKRQLQSDAGDVPKCLRCGGSLDSELTHNALSRSLGVYVCSECGSDEAMRDYSGRILPLREWCAVDGEQPAHNCSENTITLSPVNTFRHIFEGPQKQVPGYGGRRPAGEVVYARSDYDGRRWWTTWHRMQEDPAPAEQAQEIDSIMDALLELPEFRNLRSLRRTCALYAEPTSEPTEFNLYGESPGFYLWLRLITREKDYNLYVHFYTKDIATDEVNGSMT